MIRLIIIKFRHNTTSLLMFGLLIFPVVMNAQPEKKYIRQGNKEYAKNNYSESEISYRKAVDDNRKSPDAVFNIGDALYKQNKFEEAGKQFIENANLNEDKYKKSAGLYNLGNSLLMANKVRESIEAYKESLKLNPANNEAKYNLSYAQDLLKQQEEQQQQQQQQQKQDDNKNKEEQKDNENSQKDEQQDEKNRDQQQEEQSISKEDAQRLLDALANDEKDVQEKVKLEKAAKTKMKTVKNW